jgi:precorrin-6A/cobalt-precorrin-6A reductase
MSAAPINPRAFAPKPSTPSSPMPTMDSQRGDAALSCPMVSGIGTTRVLILGGTTEARLLAERLAGRPDLDMTLSLAGRTAAPARQAVPVRSGGFGGATGLADYLAREHVDVLIDATHPYASGISANASAAAQARGVRFIAVRRPPWVAVAGDRWTEVENVAEAARALGQTPRRVLVALGRNELAPLLQAPQHFYLIRSVDPVDPPLALPHATYLTGRGPFVEADELVLMRAHGIEAVIAKNSGGEATYGKIAAARALRIAVILLRRPPMPAVPSVQTVEEAIAWLDHALTSAAARGV